ncbi:apoptosis regulatory protein Siva [Lingula anatina]|uniref:Apoptosis regulatory protein Siva n=1 Tax=Lingula anatina TaxID=7574 RepID=A0A1S3IUT8_LINAN|nr:apoptosis regulatory protein Siva [Lingula anatina]|eukprot:XP_013401838.1 apoptosis regulatory protein Siva [Lingula anatina]
MPKRPNPFGDASPLQFKTVVHQKNVDMGINREENMKKVYEKTRSLLFSAAYKGIYNAPLPGDTPLPAIQEDQEMMDIGTGLSCPIAGQQKLNFHVQQSINNNLCNMSGNEPQKCMEFRSLSNGHVSAEQQMSKMPNHQSAFSSLFTQVPRPHTPVAATCISCTKSMEPTLQPCHFCDKPVCAMCVRTCTYCQGKFCQLCSVLNYDDILERPFCLSCNPS